MHRFFLTLCLTLAAIRPAWSDEVIGSPCLSAPALPEIEGEVVYVSSESELQNAIAHLSDHVTIVIAPGHYYLTRTLYIHNDYVTLRGATDRCDDVILIGRGMENADFRNVRHGVWTDAKSVKVQNLSIAGVYFHPIFFDGNAESPEIYNVKLINAGEQFIKSSRSPRWGDAVHRGVVEYVIMEYTDGPPYTDHGGGGTGYTNGVDVHGGDGWKIRNNLFKNFHTPDDAYHLRNPAVLMWRGSKNTITEGNLFINCDRAIAYGLEDDPEGSSHHGGVIRNNMIYYTEGLLSDNRVQESDAAIIVWDSPQTKVYHNSGLLQGNINNFIQFRFDSNGAVARNNLSDRSVSIRNSRNVVAADNYASAIPDMFVDPTTGDLHLLRSAEEVIDQVKVIDLAIKDYDGDQRPQGDKADYGADEFTPVLYHVFDSQNLMAQIVPFRDLQ